MMTAMLLSLLVAPAQAEFHPGETGTGITIYTVQTKDSSGSWVSWGQIVSAGNSNTGSWTAKETYWFNSSCTAELPSMGSSFRIKQASNQTTSCSPSGGSASKDFPDAAQAITAAANYSGLNGQWYEIKYGGVVGYAHQGNPKPNKPARLRYLLNAPVGGEPNGCYYNDNGSNNGFIELSNTSGSGCQTWMYFSTIEEKPSAMTGIYTMDVVGL